MNKIKSVDGLRGIAAIGVLFCHFVQAFIPSLIHYSQPNAFEKNFDPSLLFKIFSAPVISILYNGHFPVFIFFVLSGYVLTLPYFSANNSFEYKHNVLTKRLWCRYFRLGIPIFIVILISFLMNYLDMFYNNIVYDAYPSPLLFMFNLHDISFFDAIKDAFYRCLFLNEYRFVPPTWTISMEFFGSLYVLLFYIIKPKRILPSMILLFLFIYIIHSRNAVYLYAMLCGSLIPLFNKINLDKYKYLLLPVGLFLGGFQYERTIYSFLPKIIFPQKDLYNLIGAFIITSLIIKGMGARIFESKLFQFLGRISFSLYLTHMLFIFSLSSLIRISLPNDDMSLFLNFIIYVFCSIATAIIFEKFIDRNAISLTSKIYKCLDNK